MKFLIASDIHGSAYYCRRPLKAYGKEGAERMVPENGVFCIRGFDGHIVKEVTI